MMIHTASAGAAGTMWLPAPGYSPPSSDEGSYASGGESSLGGSVASLEEVVGNSEEGEIVEPLPVTKSRPLGGRSKQTPDSVQSCVTRETLGKWSEMFSLPLEFHPRVPGLNERMHLPPEGEVAIYYDMLRICIRLPFNPFLNEFFKYYDLAPSQWSPKVYRYIAAFLLICGVQGVYPSMALWSCICYVTQNNNSLGWYSVSPTSRHSRLIEPGHTVRTGWKEHFFFVKRGSTWLWDTDGESETVLALAPASAPAFLVVC